MPDHDPTPPARDSGATANVYSLDEEQPPARPHSTLARGIVWADVLADIAADDEARRLRDVA
jgi:hypothetical protein